MKGTILERIIKQKEIDVAKMKELDLSPLQNDDVVNLSSSLYESFINSESFKCDCRNQTSLSF